LEFMIDCMFECVLRAQDRIEMFSRQEMENNYDQIAKLEFVEEKEFEDELLFNIALILAEFIKIYKDDFLSILFKDQQNMLQRLLLFLNPTKKIRNPQFVHKTGIYVVCDIYEQCSTQNTSKLLNNFIPQIFNIITNDQDPSVQQACFYCLGLMVNKCRNAVNQQFIVQILKFCTECIAKHSKNYINAPIRIFDEKNALQQNDDDQQLKQRQFLGVLDNAMAAICKILKDIQWNKIQQDAQLNKIRNDALNIWFKHLPLKSDCVEAQICHQYLFNLLQNKNPIIIGQNLSNLPFLFKIFAQIRNTKLSSNKLDNVIAEFAKTICQSQPQFAQNLTNKEKQNLGL